jgi:cytoskeleton protein RodZ
MGEDESLPIGEKLKRARSRQGLEIRDLEERTKIRIKYLRALENEDWEVLPNPAYAKGFLRTYGQAVGLDADALVDEYRRTVERGNAGEQSYVFGEPVLETRRRLGQTSGWGSRALVIGAVAVAVLGVFLILGLTSNDKQKAAGRHHHGGKHGDHHGANHKGGPEPKAGGPVSLTVQPADTLEICLVPGRGAPKIDGQVVPAGQRQPAQGAYVADRFRLDMYTGGTVELGLNGHPKRIKAKARASYEITSAGVSQTDFAGQNCP